MPPSALGTAIGNATASTGMIEPVKPIAQRQLLTIADLPAEVKERIISDLASCCANRVVAPV